MLLHLNPSSGVPVYLQLESQVKQAVAAGALRTGEALPSTRKLAAELRINPNTVARAYQDLERDGVTRSVPGGGTVVADGLPGPLKSEMVKRLRPHARQLGVGGRQLRLIGGETMKVLEEELDKLGGQP